MARRRPGTSHIRTVTIASAFLPAVVAAQSMPKTAFNIPAQPLSSAIMLFSRQSGAMVIAPAPLTRSRIAPRVSGLLPPNAALAALLAGSRLQYRSEGERGYVIRAATASPVKIALQVPVEQRGGPPPPDVAALAATPTATPNPVEGEQIVVTGTRLQTGSFATPTPVTAINAGQIAQRSAGSAFEVLKDIPSFRATSGPSANSTARRTLPRPISISAGSAPAARWSSSMAIGMFPTAAEAHSNFLRGPSWRRACL